VSSGVEQLAVRTVDTAEQLASLEADWERLLRLTPLASGFESPAWVISSREAFPAGTALHAAVVTDGGEPVGIFATDLDRRGRLRFVGSRVGNYAGPVYDPDRLGAVTDAWARFARDSSSITSLDLSGLREGSPFLESVLDGGLPGWGAAVAVETNTCPEVDLTPGWDALYARHKAKNRNTWRRLERRLSGLGELEYVELTEPDAVNEAMPRLFALFEARWAGQRVTGGLAPGLQPFHLLAAPRLAGSGHVVVSALRLDGEIIAFNYGIRANGATSSYALAHDSRFNRYSPGLLLVLHVLESAARRGDPSYDFSLGEASYKNMWMSGQRRTYRLLWGRGRSRRALANRAWVTARSVPALRRLKLGGPGAILGSRRGPERPTANTPDHPGMAVGRAGRWHVYSVEARSSGPDAPELRPVGFGELLEVASPRMVELAVERNFHGDRLMGVTRDSAITSVAWKAEGARCEEVCGGHLPSGWKANVYYQPIAPSPERLADLVAVLAGREAAIVVSTEEIEQLNVTKLGEFSAGLDLRPGERDR
jgi:CelD/BcsL family acetyltransferase involved in cellulose biosynthesis